MGAEREDTDPTANRVGTEPGLGKSSGATAAATTTRTTTEDEAPPPVDFDALHAALGDPLDYEEMPSGPALERGHGEADADDLLDSLEPAVDGAAHGKALRVGESSGRSSATYASARPHTIPPTRAPAEDPNAPAVIVANETDTVPTAPPQMTVPLAATPHGPAFGGAPPMTAPMAGPSGSNPHLGAAASGPHGAAHPSSGPHPSAGERPERTPGYPHTPQAFPVQQRGIPQMTMRMPDRPVNPRRGKTPTIVVRPRGPSAKQKLVAFMAMLLLVTACGIAVIIWRKPRWLGLDSLGGGPSATTTAPAAPPAAAAAAVSTSATATIVASASTALVVAPVVPTSSASAAAAASASAKKIVKPVPPPPHPTASALPR
jgi:hypothetical protein